MDSGGKAPSQATGWVLPAAWWAVARMSLEAVLRSVSGVCERGGDGEGGGDAGDDFEGDAGGAEGFDFLVGAAEDEGVAGFEAQTDGRAPAWVSMSGWMPAWVMRGWPQRFADRDDEGGGAGEGEDFVGDEVVGEDDVGGLEEAVGAEGEEVGVAGAGADEVDVAGFGLQLDFGVGEGVLAGVGAGGACVEAADLAGGEGVEELLAGFVEGLKLEDFAAEVAELGEPGARGRAGGRR